MLREAVEVLENASAPLDHAHALYELGVALSKADDKKSARTVLRRAMEGAEKAEAAALFARSCNELRASGGRLRGIGPRTGVDSLTKTERRVVTLVLEGKSNPSIAVELQVAQRTVEFHLSNVYRKLGILRREELPAGLGQSAPL
ncbi:helix-turn-helix transcriptional regulator [Streptomyces lavendulocolor]|uniref:helix-turn-helix transcriptional regulator n=1 Tax=Streptomyces lavendulocolor TaxID=67316 RepID=UPI0033DCF81B